jgi:uncharacterized membrane protein
MAIAVMTWVLAIPLLGAMTGLRTMTPIALLCLFSYQGHLDVDGTWAAWTGMKVSVIIFCVLALGELVGDKLPMTPNRISAFPLAARVIFGGTVGALAATSVHGYETEGILLGAFSALVGAFLGFYVRRHLTESSGLPKFAVALAEDALAIGISVWALGIITG